MPADTAPQSMSNIELATLCASETNLFMHQKAYDPQYCFELCRRAFQEKVDEAWELVVAQYKSFVVGWLRKHSKFTLSKEEAEDDVFDVFARIWRAITPEKFKQFKELRSLLGYLEHCTRSFLVDRSRSSERHQFDELDDEMGERIAAHDPTPEQQTFTELENQRLLEILRQEVPDKKEWLVLTAMYFYDLKPRDVFARYKKEFESVDEVYRVWQNIRARLRRNDELRGFVKFDGDDDLV